MTRQAFLPRDGLGAGSLLRRPCRAGEHHFTALPPHPVHFHLGRGFGHDDHRAQPELPSGVGQRLAVVAARGGDDAAGATPTHQPGEGVVGAADLEGADGLEQLALEGDRHADACGEIGASRRGVRIATPSSTRAAARMESSVTGDVGLAV